jgi:hypothetical protein
MPMPQSTPPQQNPFLAAVAQYGPLFLSGARNNHPLDAYADMVLDTLEPDPTREAAFRAWIARPDWFPELMRALPGAGNFSQWFQALAQQILADLDAPPEDDTGGNEEGLSGDDDEGISEGLSPR